VSRETRTQVYVAWLDASFERDIDRAEDASCVLLHTTGWLVREDRQVIAIAGEIKPADSTSRQMYRDVTTIPKVLIRFRRDRDVRLHGEE